MEFALGILMGSLLTGFAAAYRATIWTVAHGWLARMEAAAKEEVAEKAESLRAKL